MPLAIYFWRAGRKTAATVAAALFALIAVGVIAAIAGGGGSGSTAPTTLSQQTTVPTQTTVAARPCLTYKDAKKPQTCIAKSGSACSTYAYSAKPTDCFTAAQLRDRVAARKAHRLAVAKAKQRAAAQARAQAAAAARARAAAIAAANAWHKGYLQQSDNIYWKWVNGGSCQSFAQNGCWHVAVITRDGCPSYVAVNAKRIPRQHDRQLATRQPGLRDSAKTERVFELDADTGGVTANNVQIDCN